MDASSFKLQPPTFDSKKESWGKFETDFCSYVIIQGGEHLVDAVLGCRGMNTSIIHNPIASPSTNNSRIESTIYILRM